MDLIKYDIPEKHDRHTLDNLWFCPTLFSQFSLENL
jgi:hypothetical protein